MYLCTKIDSKRMNTDHLPYGVSLVQLPENVDERGSLSFLEANEHIPFDVKRVFWITHVPADKTRGGHAHWTCHEAVFPVSGSFEIEVDDGVCAATLVMDNPSVGVVIPAGVWCELRHFAPGTVCVAVASESFNPDGYSHDKVQWRHERKEMVNDK